MTDAQSKNLLVVSVKLKVVLKGFKEVCRTQIIQKAPFKRN